MFRNGLDSMPTVAEGETIAEGVAISAPIRGMEIMDIVRRTGGKVVAVDDEEVEEALLLLGRRGIYVEPTSALPVAAFFVRSLPGGRSRRRPAHGARAQGDRKDVEDRHEGLIYTG